MDLQLSSIFLLYVKKVEINYVTPWKNNNPIFTTGSGFGVKINDKKYVLTNAHVVENSNFIEIITQSSDKRYIPDIIDISPEIDLALLYINDNDFWNNIVILELDEVPEKGENIKVIGFPSGGFNSSITEGIVSRLTNILYSKSIYNLVIQVDAAINPGNSGGPALNNKNKVIGVAFSHNIKGQNISYVIPSFIIIHYLNNIQKLGKFPGLCDLEIDTSSLENKYIREYYKLNGSGILVNNVDILGASGHILKINDIITKIDDIQINNDKTVYLNISSKNLEKIPYWHILRQKNSGDNVKLSIIRNNKNKTINFKIYPMIKKIVPLLSKDISNTYFIYGGLIFIPLNFWYMFKINKEYQTVLDDDKYDLLKYTNYIRTQLDEEIVILSSILQTRLTSGYNYENIRLIKINDKDIKNLKDVHNICMSINDDFVKFEFENNKIIILNRKLSHEQSEQISQQYLKVKHEHI